MEILSSQQITQKLRRLTYEILEHNIEADEFFLIGVNNMGYKFAQSLYKSLSNVSEKTFHLNHLTINPADPLESPIGIDMDTEKLLGKTVLLIDDVANSGRTLFYACKGVMDILPKKIATVVLVDRTHKLFPIKINHVGLSLATTLKENIKVSSEENDLFSVSLS